MKGCFNNISLESLIRMVVAIHSLLLLSVTCFAASNPHCRISHDNRVNGSKVDCKGLRLRGVPPGLPEDTKYLDLSNNEIRVLQSFSFNRLSQLLHLYLNSNQIWKLEPMAFEGLTQLMVLRLSDNNLKLDNITYSPEIFLPLLNLQDLDIGHNDGYSRGQIPDSIFSPLLNLKKLRIDTFERETFGTGFASLLNLEYLDIATGINGSMYYCGLQRLSNTTFSAFENTTLSKLDMSGCEIYFIDIGVFLPLKHISEINMENVRYITTLSLMKTFSGLKERNISKLLLSKTYAPPQVEHEITDQVITKDLTATLTDLCIEYIDFSNNKIVFVDKEIIFLFKECIKHIDFSQNNILGSVLVFIALSVCNLLEFFDISNQQNFQNSWHRPDHTPADQLIKMSQNKFGNPSNTSNEFRLSSYAFGISQIDAEVGMIFSTPPNIRVAKMRSVTPHFGKFFLTNFRKASHLNTLDIAYNYAWGLVNHIYGLENVQILDLSGNEGYGMTTEFMTSFPKVQHLSMNDMGFDKKTLLAGGHILEGIRRMSNISHLELAGNSIRFIADTITPTLKSINLARNNLISFPINLYTSPNIDGIDLSSNAITYFKGEEIAMLEDIGMSNQLSVNLSGNPISCSCNALPFINWIFTSEVIFDLGGNYTCITDNGTLSSTLTVFKQLHYNWTYCQGKIWLPISLALFSLLNLVIVSGILVTRNWTWIQHYLLVIIGRGVQRVCRADFDKDAFIAHSDEDGYFVRHVIMDSLQSFNLRLILPDRDFLPGQFVADNVVESVNNSWKTVLIVTDSFLDDPWSYFIMRTVSYSVSYPNSNRVILLMIGDVNRGRLPESLLNVTEEEDILETDEFPGPDSDIWTEIRDRVLTEAI